jgi:hypothetical protein
MKDIELDFYSEFDGDTEIIFIIKTDNYQKKLRIWSGYFSQIMRMIEMPEDTPWSGLAYYFHLMIGWQEDYWQIPNLEEALLQLQSIKLEPDYSNNQIYPNGTYLILSEMINMLSESIDKNLPVYIQQKI